MDNASQHYPDDMDRQRLAKIEDVITQGTGTRAEILGEGGRGGLADAVSIVASAQSVAIVSGFMVPTDLGFQPETDGPPGAAALAAYLVLSGRQCVMMTDECNVPVCRAAVGAYEDLTPSQLRVLRADEELVYARASLARLAVDTLIFVERPGPTAAGTYLSMNGTDVGSVTAPLERLIGDVDSSLALGDGGNEVGMGRLPASLINALPHGRSIRCVVPTDGLVVGGTSNWAAWALIVAHASSESGWRKLARDVLTPMRFRRCLEAVVEAGGVDGMTGRHRLAVDGIDLAEHEAMLSSLRSLLDEVG